MSVHAALFQLLDNLYGSKVAGAVIHALVLTFIILYFALQYHRETRLYRLVMGKHAKPYYAIWERRAMAAARYRAKVLNMLSERESQLSRLPLCLPQEAFVARFQAAIGEKKPGFYGWLEEGHFEIRYSAPDLQLYEFSHMRLSGRVKESSILYMVEGFQAVSGQKAARERLVNKLKELSGAEDAEGAKRALKQACGNWGKKPEKH